MAAVQLENALRRTPLYAAHQRLGARFVPFGGWEMPVQYTGVIEEHLAVRREAGLFDVSHMGEVAVRGPKALQFLQQLTSNDVSKLAPGRAQYSLLLNPQGGVVDDIIVYRLAEKEYLLCVNAGTTAKDVAWIREQNSFGASVEDVSDQFAQIAVQGPRAAELAALVLQRGAGELDEKVFPPFAVKPYRPSPLRDQVLAARTGYTGEDGFEIFCTPRDAEPLWNQLLDHGAKLGVRPAGLGARDTLRLEACYPLYGHELRDDIDALTSGLGWVVKFSKGDFIGKPALEKRQAAGAERKLCGIEPVEAAIFREGYRVFSGDGAEIGWVTSGTKTPFVNRAIALAFVDIRLSEPGAELFVEVRHRRVRAKVAPIPFYKRQKD
jgi:aminomethyltransferase